MSGVCCFLFCLLLTSCSTFKLPGSKKEEKVLDQGFSRMSPADFADHLASLKNSFLSTPGVRILPLSKNSKKYLASISNEIIANNEIFFKQFKEASVTVLDVDAPLHFSLPKGELFISRGLLEKYIKHESMLVSILSYELVRSENLLYPRRTIVPVGYLPLERMLQLNRLGLEEKMEIHKWAHYLTIRSGFDGEYYLSWLQTQNRNTADFILQVGDANIINREESLFKAFLIKKDEEENPLAKKNSSKNFYTFINSIRDNR